MYFQSNFWFVKDFFCSYKDLFVNMMSVIYEGFWDLG